MKVWNKIQIFIVTLCFFNVLLNIFPLINQPHFSLPRALQVLFNHSLFIFILLLDFLKYLKVIKHEISAQFHLLFFFSQWLYLLIQFLHSDPSTYFDSLFSSLFFVLHYLQFTLKTFDLPLTIQDAVHNLSQLALISLFQFLSIFLDIFGLALYWACLWFKPTNVLSLP